MERPLSKAVLRAPRAENPTPPDRRRPKASMGSLAPVPGTAAPVRAVTFDVGGTLIECWPSVGHIYAEVANRHGFGSLSPAVLNRQFKAVWKACPDFSHTIADWSALVDATFFGLVHPPPSQSFFPQLYDRFSEPDAWHVFEDVAPALANLKARGLKLGIVSNWDDRLRPLLRRLRLDHYFESIVVSCEVGARKPDPRIFEAAGAALGSAPGETLHVGDHREMDYQGARAAGLRARWLRRGARTRSRETWATLAECDKL
jgi:putative hydrolase of the HAD superfamily